MSQSLFRGSGVALVTPMTPDGIDFPALEQLIEWHIASGTDALVLCATTGEGATLTYAERAEIIERSVRQVNGRVPVIVGTGSNNTASAIALSREACAAAQTAFWSSRPTTTRRRSAGSYVTSPPSPTPSTARSSSTMSHPAPA